MKTNENNRETSKGVCTKGVFGLAQAELGLARPIIFASTPDEAVWPGKMD